MMILTEVIARRPFRYPYPSLICAAGERRIPPSAQLWPVSERIQVEFRPVGYCSNFLSATIRTLTGKTRGKRNHRNAHYHV